MIDDVKYKEVLDSGLLLDHYFLLCNIKKGTPNIDSKRIQGFINLMTKKGYLLEGALTEKGEEFIKTYDLSATVTVKKGLFGKRDLNLGTWAGELHVKCQEKLFTLVGRKQISGKISNKAYPFLPNATDLAKALSNCITAYKLTDYNKIEETIMKRIDICNREGNWFPQLHYYIMKHGMSQMVTDMEGGEGTEGETFKSTQKFG